LFDGVRAALGMVRRELAGTDVAGLGGPEATAMLNIYADLAKVAQAGMTLAAGRVETTNKTSLTGTNFRSAKEAVSAAAGISTTAADSLLDLSARLEDHATVKEAFVQGSLSAAEATEVAKAADRNASATQDLLDLARKKNFSKLRTAAAGVQSPDPVADARRAELARARRDVRHWVDSDGMAHLKASGPADVVAAMWARLTKGADARFRAARREGSRSSSGHYRFDALADLCFRADGAPGSGRGAQTQLFIMVDFAALQRGVAAPGETCEIPGLGPVPVEAARAHLGDATLRFILSDGVDVRSVAHLGRHVGAHLRSALAWKFRCCIDCGRSLGLELDHLEPVAKGGVSSYDNIRPRCRLCHREKTARDYPEGTWGYRRREAAVAESRARRSAGNRPARSTATAETVGRGGPGRAPGRPQAQGLVDRPGVTPGVRRT
jgi:hypothetical protein